MNPPPWLSAVPFVAMCNIDTPPQEPVVSSGTVVQLSQADRLTRIAMAIKGTRPTVDEYAQVLSDPTTLPSVVDTYLNSEAFGLTVRDIENETLLVRLEDLFPQLIPPGEFSEEWSSILNEEPLVLIEHVVMSDRPYTDIVTTADTFMGRISAEVWSGLDPAAYDPNGPEWQLTQYIDGRPPAGVLSTGGWNLRWDSTPANANRHAAAAMASQMICIDYLSQDIPLGTIDLTDNDAVYNAILNEPTCVGCHQGLDPLAGFFLGMAGNGVFRSGWPTDQWRPNDPRATRNRTGRAPGYYGQGGVTLEDLGQFIAQDPQFTRCTARRYISWLSQIPSREVPYQRIIAAESALIDGGMSIKAMVREIMLSDAFAASHSTDPEEAEQLIGSLRTRPEQLDRLFRDLAGFTWLTQRNNGGPPTNLLTQARRGFKVHSGGIDANTKLVSSFMSSAASMSVLRSLAAEAAGHLVDADFALPAADRRLLTLTELTTVDEATLRSQFAALHLLVLGEFVDPHSMQVDETYALFLAADATTTDPADTWKLLLTAMFQDIRVAYH